MSTRNQVSKILAVARAGEVVWWRRGGFNEEPFREVEPKWHVLTSRLDDRSDPEMDPKDKPVYTALCGYKKSFNERILLEFPNVRKVAPKKDTRCRKCIKDLPDWRIKLARMSTTPVTTVPEKETETP